MEGFLNVIYTQDLHMKNIDKVCRKVVKIYQDENNEVVVLAQVAANHHLHYVMEGEPLKALSYKERVNIAELVFQQVTTLVTDMQVDVHLLLTVVCDYTRKVFSNEFIKIVAYVEDCIANDLIYCDNIKYIESFLKGLKSKINAALMLFRSIGKTFTHGDPKTDKYHKFLLDANVKIKASISKYLRDYEKRYNITSEDTNGPSKSNANTATNRKINGYPPNKPKESKKSIKPLIMRLDFNNKIEPKRSSSTSKPDNLKKQSLSNTNFDLNEIKKRFNIEENNQKLRLVQNTVSNILHKGPLEYTPTGPHNNSHYSMDATENHILSELYDKEDYSDIFRMIEKGWRREKLSKICLKIRVVNRIRRLQRYWRMYKYNRYNNFALKIQRFFKKVVITKNLSRITQVARLFKIRKNWNMTKIKHALRLYIKNRRIKKQIQNSSPERLQHILSVGSKNIGKLVLLQKHVRSWIAWKDCIRYKLCSREQGALKKKKVFKQTWQNYYKSVYAQESSYYTREIVCKWELWNVEDYIEKELDAFDKRWDDYELKLRDYLNKHFEMKDWIQQTNSLGVKYWINIKTLKDQKEHPSVKVFRTNKKLLKDKADQEMGGSMQVYTQFKELLEDFSDANVKEYNSVLEEHKYIYLRDI